jgi:hypothetical protein
MASEAPNGWTVLGSGAFNTVYLSDDKQFVLKLPHTNDDKTDRPERSVEVWNEINGGPPYARLEKITDPTFDSVNISGSRLLGYHVMGWVCPYIEGLESTPQEICKALIDIYNRTGRIVMDPYGDNNFKTTPDGKVVCVDIGVALKRDIQEDKTYAGFYEKRNSIVSRNTWTNIALQLEISGMFSNKVIDNPELLPVQNMVKALLFIKDQRPDIFNVDFLTDENLTNQLAEAYDADRSSELSSSTNTSSLSDSRISSSAEDTQDDAPDGLSILNAQRPVELAGLKESCKRELLRYIKARGTLKNQEFKASLFTRTFRNTATIIARVEKVKSLINDIEKAQSIDEIRNHLVNNNNSLLQSKTSLPVKIVNRAARYLGNCICMVEKAKKIHDETQEHRNHLKF